MESLLAANQYISSSGIVTVYLLMIVFTVLAFLVIVLTFGHKIMGALQKAVQRAKDKKKSKKENAPALPETPQVSAVQEDDAEVAAIVAAITMMMQAEAPHKKAKFVVRKIERI